MGIWGVEATDAAKYPIMHRAVLQQRIIQHKMSIVPKLSNPMSYFEGLYFLASLPKGLMFTCLKCLHIILCLFTAILILKEHPCK